MIGIPYYKHVGVIQLLSLIGPLGLGPHGVPSPKPSKSLEVNLCNLNRWEHGIYHFTWGPKYDTDAYMTTLFLEVRLGTCVESWVEQKRDTTLNTIPTNKNNRDMTLTIINKILMIFWGLKVGTCHHERDLGHGIPCEPILTFFNWTPIFDWYVVQRESKNKYKDMCFEHSSEDLCNQLKNSTNIQFL